MRTHLFLSISTLLLIVFFFSCGSPAPISDVEQVETDEMVSSEPEVCFEESSVPLEMEAPSKLPMCTDEPPESKNTGPVTEPKPCTSEQPVRGSKGNSGGYRAKEEVIEEVIKEVKPKLDDYEILLEVDEVIRYKRSGNMTVWIGKSEYAPTTSEGYVRDSTLISYKPYAKITPIADDFDISPSTSVCLKIESDGSSERFTLTHKKAKIGKTKVSAKVELFDSQGCIGDTTQKTTKILTVTVKVKPIDLLWILFDIIWDHIEIFLGSLLGLLATIALFKIRKKAKIDENN